MSLSDSLWGSKHFIEVLYDKGGGSQVLGVQVGRLRQSTRHDPWRYPRPGPEMNSGVRLLLLNLEGPPIHPQVGSHTSVRTLHLLRQF